MKALLLGRGWVGSRLAVQLAKKGHVVEAWGRETSGCNTSLLLADDYEHAARRSGAASIHPDAIIYSAADYGGIAYVAPYPWTRFETNLRMGLGAVEVWLASQAPLLVLVGTACSYPEPWSAESRLGVSPLHENFLWSGLPHESVEGYGLAKRTVERAAVLASREHPRTEKGEPRRIVHLLLANLYGPGDHYDPVKAHAPAAILMRAVCAAQFEDCRPMTCWGTGDEVRDLLYIDDAVDGIARAVTVSLDGPLTRVNLGSGRGTTTREIAAAAITAVSTSGTAQFSGGGPGAQAVKVLDVATAERLLDWRATTPLSVGMCEAKRELGAGERAEARAEAWREAIQRERERAAGEAPRGT